jgi:hypothetical protein
VTSMRSRREALCKILNKWKSFVRVVYFFGAAQIEERFLALLGMTTTHKTEKNKKRRAQQCCAPTGNNIDVARGTKILCLR